MSVLTIHKEPLITTAAIHRPDAMNAINFEIMDRLEQLLDEIESDNEIRLFILTGSGKSFISGGDLKEFHQIRDAEGAKKMSNRMISLLNRIEELNCWTLAALNGHTYGGGWEIMLSFDFRVASNDVQIGFTQGNFYLPPGWGGIHNLSKAVGRNQALYWLASGQVINAQTALQHGLIQEVFDEYAFDEKLSLLKSELTRNDRDYIQYIKRKNLQLPADEVDPFSKFWVSEEHLKRVDDFLSRKR
ncbi:MAG: enoyl-CoA hydratase/isomerase family protein [Balneolaceae bacterium]